VALMLMAGIISWLRPHAEAKAPTRSSVIAVEAFSPEKANALVTINGMSEAEYAEQINTQQQQGLLAYQNPKYWTAADVKSIASRNGKTILIFTDGTIREVTAALYQQLSGNLQLKVGYQREQ
jgi:hypothetical protein